MKTTLRLTIPAAALVLLHLPIAVVQAQDYTYTTNNGTITITGYTGSGGALTIPGMINSLPVTSIGTNAFSHCASLTSVAIPDRVTDIGDLAFYGCTSLTSVAIPDGVATIGANAFDSCTNLTSVTIPRSVTSIGDGAFRFGLSLTAITVDALNVNYASVDGVLFDRSQTTLIQCPGTKAGNYTVPNGVATIGSYAFSYCMGLTGVTIPDSVTGLGEGAFSHCTNLTVVAIPDNVTSIGGYAFTFCTGLTTVTFGKSVSFIGDGAFRSCTGLRGAYFYGNAPGVGYRSFYNNLAVVYRLPGTTGWGPTFSGGHPVELWVLPNPVVLATAPNFGIQASGFSFLISWATNVSVVVEASTTLGNPMWLPLATNALTSGTNYFTDPDWTGHPARFYRIRSQ